MKKLIIKVLFTSVILVLMAVKTKNEERVSLTVEVNELRNSTGQVIFSLYDKDGSIPDEELKKSFKNVKVEISNKSAQTTFKNLPKGKYAVNIVHDENKNGKIDKGWILPIEGIGFSNFKSIGLSNKPNFKKASFELNKDRLISVKAIYM
jgi:uncharacterized protein (DUF2141 family)